MRVSLADIDTNSPIVVWFVQLADDWYGQTLTAATAAVKAAAA